MRVLVVEDERRWPTRSRVGCAARAWRSTSPTTATPGTRRRWSPATTWWCSTATCPGCTATGSAPSSSASGALTRVLMLTASGTVADQVEGCRSARTTTWPSRSPSRSWSPGSGARPAGHPRRPRRCSSPATSRWTRPGAVDPGGPPVDLTRKEFGVLEVLLGAGGAVVSSEELLERVWDANADPFTTTVRVTVMTLRKEARRPAADRDGGRRRLPGRPR